MVDNKKKDDGGGSYFAVARRNNGQHVLLAWTNKDMDLQNIN